MVKAPPKVANEGWKNSGWRYCGDVTIQGILENAPRYLRCMRCFRLVTHGEAGLGSCICGNRRLNGATALTWAEILLLKLGWFPLKKWEADAIRPLAPVLGYKLRLALFRPTQRASAAGGRN